MLKKKKQKANTISNWQRKLRKHSSEFEVTYAKSMDYYFYFFLTKHSSIV